MTSTNKSSERTKHQILGVMSASRVEQALRDWANLPGFYRGQPGKRNAVMFGQKPSDAERAFRRMVKRYPEFFLQQGRPMTEEKAFGLLAPVADLLRMAWDSQSLRKREWYLADLEGVYHHEYNRFLDPPTFALPLEALVYYFRRNSERALHCPNPECPAPYFFSTKKGQKYCSPECARPSQLESKRRWWSDYRAGKTRTKE
jgi:hypothetical protein